MKTTILSTFFLLGFCAPLQLQGEAPPPEEPLSLWYRRPAVQWTEALPIGNGRLGGMIFGGIDGERIQLNEATLWAGWSLRPEQRRLRHLAARGPAADLRW